MMYAYPCVYMCKVDTIASFLPLGLLFAVQREIVHLLLTPSCFMCPSTHIHRTYHMHFLKLSMTPCILDTVFYQTWFFEPSATSSCQSVSTMYACLTHYFLWVHVVIHRCVCVCVCVCVCACVCVRWYVPCVYRAPQGWSGARQPVWSCAFYHQAEAHQEAQG